MGLVLATRRAGLSKEFECTKMLRFDLVVHSQASHNACSSQAINHFVAYITCGTFLFCQSSYLFIDRRVAVTSFCWKIGGANSLQRRREASDARESGSSITTSPASLKVEQKCTCKRSWYTTSMSFAVNSEVGGQHFTIKGKAGSISISKD